MAKIVRNEGEEELHSEEGEPGKWEIEIKSNQPTRVSFRFMYTPEYLVNGSYLMISDQRLKLFGEITKVYHDAVPHGAALSHHPIP